MLRAATKPLLNARRLIRHTHSTSSVYTLRSYLYEPVDRLFLYPPIVEPEPPIFKTIEPLTIDDVKPWEDFNFHTLNSLFKTFLDAPVDKSTFRDVELDPWSAPSMRSARGLELRTAGVTKQTVEQIIFKTNATKANTAASQILTAIQGGDPYDFERNFPVATLPCKHAVCTRHPYALAWLSTSKGHPDWIYRLVWGPMGLNSRGLNSNDCRSIVTENTRLMPCPMSEFWDFEASNPLDRSDEITKMLLT